MLTMNAATFPPTPKKGRFTEEFIDIQEEFQVQWVMNPDTSGPKSLRW